MAELQDKSVHLVVTSPPYWQLKDYGTKNLQKNMVGKFFMLSQLRKEIKRKFTIPKSLKKLKMRLIG